MGLLDVLNGMQNGPRGAPQPGKQEESGGMSPMMMALLALLAYKAFKGSGSGRPSPVPGDAGRTAAPPASGGGLGDLLGSVLGGGRSGTPANPSMPAGQGGLGDLLGGLFGGRPGAPAQANAGSGLGGLLGGLLAGGAAGSVLGSGLDNLLKDLQSQGYGQAAQSWVSSGPNEPIPPSDLESALGADTLDALSSQTGMSRSELLQGLSQQLPEMVNQLTPDGRLPTEQEAARWI